MEFFGEKTFLGGFFWEISSSEKNVFFWENHQNLKKNTGHQLSESPKFWPASGGNPSKSIQTRGSKHDFCQNLSPAIETSKNSCQVLSRAPTPFSLGAWLVFREITSRLCSEIESARDVIEKEESHHGRQCARI